MKQTKKVRIDIHVEFDSTIDDIISQLQRWKEEYKDQYDSLYIEEESAYDGGYYHYLVGHRLETDKEEKNRLVCEERWKTERLESDRQQYEKLKAKFEQ
jgi:hypothetical protein